MKWTHFLILFDLLMWNEVTKFLGHNFGSIVSGIMIKWDYDFIWFVVVEMKWPSFWDIILVVYIVNGIQDLDELCI